ncbi:hypothetical protein GE061_012934 [Apolygus lucorum]|uniref:Uncharacterized protein n=1 Tax=Apolygus lucorum TaxID=248454 RepID=A0A6A4JJH6_APOLU|nr:hypothetical protein GE061_012934 [Apolygus lucorum]
MMKESITVWCLVFLNVASPIQSLNVNITEWESFKAAHHKHYGTSEIEALRMKIYFRNKEFIEAHNERYARGLSSYTMKMNHLGDLLAHEVRQNLNGLKHSRASLRSKNAEIPARNSSLPKAIDWRTKGVVTPVKDQGQCGSCWAFSSTGAVEGQHALKKGELVSLSEQQLIDCSFTTGNEGCEGGWMDYAFSYIKKNGGLDSEDSYPYTAKDDECMPKGRVAATVSGFVDVEAGSESALQEALATIGPISVAIDASKKTFHYYDQGVYDEPNCDKMMLDHGVLAVGYGEHKGVPYWIIKNSWGPSWGNEGYIWMKRNDDNQCGIASKASYPLV